MRHSSVCKHRLLGEGRKIIINPCNKNIMKKQDIIEAILKNDQYLNILKKTNKYEIDTKMGVFKIQNPSKGDKAMVVLNCKGGYGKNSIMFDIKL